MADAAGLAVGVISLGLQLYAGVAGYIDSFKDRKNQLAAISAQTRNFQASITALQNVLPSITAKQTDGGAAASLALKTVEEELWALKLFLNKLEDSSSPAAGTSTTIQGHKNKLTYPFHRPRLEKLQKKLESANNALQTSIQVLGLVTTDSIDVTISKVNTNLDKSHSVIVDIESHTKDLNTSLSSMATALAPTITAVSDMKNSLDACIPQINTTLAGVHDSLAMGIPDIRDGMADVSREIRLVKDDNQGTMAAVSQGFQTSHEHIHQLLDVASNLTMHSASGTSLIRKDVAELNGQFHQLLRLIGDNEALIEPDRSRLALRRLLSKPSSLKDAYNNFQQVATAGIEVPKAQKEPGHKYHEEALFDNPNSCHCRKSTNMEQQGTRLGALYLVKNTTTHQRHLPGCRFAQFGTTSTSQAMLVSYTGLRGILSLALELSISWRSGAGGFSISPNITFRPMVDKHTSPVFRLIHLFNGRLNNIYWSNWWGEEEEKHITKQLLDVMISNILKLYREKKCLPYDVDEHGESALHLWVQVLASWYSAPNGGHPRWTAENFESIVLSSVRELAEAGTTVALFDYNGRSPLDVLVDDMVNYSTGSIKLHPRLTEALYTLDTDFTSRTHPYMDGNSASKWPRDWCNLLNKYPSLAEIFDFGALSKLIVAGEQNRACYLLGRHPDALKEMNLAKQTVFHLAVDSPATELLEILLKAAKDVPYDFDTPDSEGFHALERAALRSGITCRNESLWDPCKDCPCTSSFMTMQSYGWQLPSHRLSSPQYLLNLSSYRCKLKIINMITGWRESFADMGRSFLTTFESHQFHLDRGCVLDGHLHMVVQRLIRRGIINPSKLEDLQTNEKFMDGISVYHDLFNGDHSTDSAVRSAELLFRSGFRDIDYKNMYGMTPLIANMVYPRYPHPLNLALWLLNHGADPLAFWPANDAMRSYNTSLRAAHRVLDWTHYGHASRSDIIALRELIFKVAPLDVPDGCRCGCVNTGGCGTTKVLFSNLWVILFKERQNLYFSKDMLFTKDREQRSPSKWNECSKVESGNKYQRGERQERKEVIQRWKQYGEDCTDDETVISESHGRLGTRSNERKALRRSICNLSNFLQHLAVDFCRWSHVTTAALRLLTFEALEMRHTCCRIPYPPEHSQEEIREIQEEDREMLGLLDGLVEEFTTELRDSQDVFGKFLVRYWSRRIEEVLSKLHAREMTADERSAAEHIGVTWVTSGTKSRRYKPKYRMPSPSEELQRFMNDMDGLMAEYI
ncbi:hypothetical protein HD806DRAFT_550738 [Xylariaceae sp. AK1471]|nr:hypothetical protein HD806DRAFT_550738 [Xylariaceae sp. AK1471]